MKLKCTTDDPRDLADAVYGALNRHVFGWRRRHRQIADKVTPLVMESLYESRLQESTDPFFVEISKIMAGHSVRAGLGILQYLFWSWVLPLVIEWIVNWYFSADGSAMRARHRAESEASNA